jgi:23S rRNA pseudoU1915 N3-methylase RlmH
MKITVHTIGKIKVSELKNLIDQFRLSAEKYARSLQWQFIEHKDKYPSEKLEPAVVLDGIGLDLHKTLLLAEWGKQYNSSEFQALLGKYRLQGEDISFLIGNAYGWKQPHQKEKYISLSKMTYNHELAALMLWEQLYRYADKIRGGNYSK